MRTFSCLSVLIWLCIACHENSPKTTDPEPDDTTAVAADTAALLAPDSLPDPPKAADGLFDDFI